MRQGSRHYPTANRAAELGQTHRHVRVARTQFLFEVQSERKGSQRKMSRKLGGDFV